jgi:AraC-like DNA-binding protein
MDFVFSFRHGCPLGRIVMVGESHGKQTPPIHALRTLKYYALVYLFKGRGLLRDASGNRRELGGGDAFLLRPGVPHHYGPLRHNCGGWNEYYIVFEGPVFDVWRKTHLLDKDCEFFRLAPDYLWLKRFQEVVDIRAVPSHQSSLSDISRLQLLLADILAHQSRLRVGDDEVEWRERAYALIAKNDGGRIDFRAIARILGVSYDTFRRRFARLAGQSPMQYHQTLLADRASTLLCGTRLTHAEIADRLGICDEFHFSRMFKKITGYSPRAFRTRFLTRMPP